MTVGAGKILERLLYDATCVAYARPTAAERKVLCRAHEDDGIMDEDVPSPAMSASAGRITMRMS